MSEVQNVTAVFRATKEQAQQLAKLLWQETEFGELFAIADGDYIAEADARMRTNERPQREAATQ